MPDYKENSLHADSDFERLIQPYSESYISELISSSSEYVVYAWKDTLVSPAFLYQKMTDAGIPVTIRCLEFSEKSEAISYICARQLDRADLTGAFRKYLIGKEYLTDLTVPGNESMTNLKVAMRIAQPLKISAGTVLKYGEYAKALDKVYEIEPKLADFILNEIARISHENTLELLRTPPESLKRILSAVESGELKWISYADLKYDVRGPARRTRTSSSVERSAEVDETLAIRQIPVFDPDAQVSSLALTIPSWTSSVKRVTDATDFSKISNAARNRLMRNMSNLVSSIKILTKAIEEE